ncbi:hypothetical protein P7C73_g910, partial [Tremellales sp. Uapishka_1]
MPSCRVTNRTTQPLNIALKQVTALHFENTVQPGQTIKFKPGKVWFSLEAIHDDGTKASRYSAVKSAATIALLSLAVGTVAVTAGVAILPDVLIGGVTGAAVTKGLGLTKALLVKNSSTIAKVSSDTFPKAIERLSVELGGLNALQREVLSIIASPTLTDDVRNRASNLLRSLHAAYMTDRSRTTSSSSEATLVPLIEEDVEIGSHESDNKVESRSVTTGNVLRVHGIYMSKRREYEIRVGEGGKMVLWDVRKKKLVD